MKIHHNFEEFIQKVDKGLEIAFQKMLDEKRQKGTKLVIMQEGKVVQLTPDEYEAYQKKKSKS